MALLGLVLLVLGLIFNVSVLVMIGAVLLVVGLILNLVPINGRRRRLF